MNTAVNQPHSVIIAETGKRIAPVIMRRVISGAMAAGVRQLFKFISLLFC